MKTKLFFVFVLLWLSFSPTYSQTTPASSPIWDDEKVFGQTEIPAKWANESAVILAQSLELNYFREKRNVIQYTEKLRRRIKLLDKSAVISFSQFYMANNEDVKIYIEKPNGKQIRVSTNAAVRVKGEIPAFYQTHYSNISYKKLAIPSLEIGDIIDYTYTIDETRTLYNDFAFEPVVQRLEMQYPVIKQRVQFLVDKGFYINSNSSNGAPELTLLEAELPSKKSYIRLFQLIDDMRDKQESELWYYPMRSIPVIRFQVFFLYKEGSEGFTSYFIGDDPEKPNQTWQPLSLVRAMNFAIRSEFSTKTKEIQIKAKKTRLYTPEAVAEYLYYVLRYEGLGRWDDQSGFNTSFVGHGSWLFQKFKIPVEVIIYTPRYSGNIDNILFASELSLALRIKLNGKYHILSDFTPYSNFGDLDPYMEGTKAYVFSPIPSLPRKTPDTLYIKPSTYKDNMTDSHLKVSFNKTLDETQIRRKVIEKGHNRMRNWKQIASYAEFYHTDQEKYGDPKLPKKPSHPKAAAWEREKRLYSKRAHQNREEWLESSAQQDFNSKLISHDDFELIQSGRYHNKPELIYTELFTLESLINKVGDNYILNIGELIGNQVEIRKDAEERKYDVHMANARSFKNHIEISIPNGYTVEGIERLNVSIENETGGFVATARLQASKLVIDTNKMYKTHFIDKEQWPKMLEFLNVAYQFSQEKVLLHKK